MQLIRHADATSSPAARWATATLQDATATSPAELDVLQDHAARCKGLRGRLFRVHCAVDTADAFLAGRVISVFVVAFIGLGFLFSLLA